MTYTAPSTTTAPRPTPTAPPSTQRPATTTTTTSLSSTTTTAGRLPADVMLRIDNGHSMAVAVTVNDRDFTLAPGEHTGPLPISRHASGTDTVEVSLVEAPSCRFGATDRYFGGPGTYDMGIGVPLGAGCPNGQGVGFVIFKV
jgi:hypothetical protein